MTGEHQTVRRGALLECSLDRPPPGPSGAQEVLTLARGSLLILSEHPLELMSVLSELISAQQRGGRSLCGVASCLRHFMLL